MKSSIGLGNLLLDGIGDTIRVSLSDDPVKEVIIGNEILKSLNLRNRGVKIISCPSCARQAFQVIELIKSKNFAINNIDINIIAQKPKINKYSKKMIKTISKLCEINPNQINIKGKTTEKLGLIGKGEAVASEVVASVTKYD